MSSDGEEKCPETLADARDSISGSLSSFFAFHDKQLYAYLSSRRDKEEGRAGLWTTQHSKQILNEELDRFVQEEHAASAWLKTKQKQKQITDGLDRYLHDKEFLQKTVSQNVGLLHYRNCVKDLRTEKNLGHSSYKYMLKTTSRAWLPKEQVPEEMVARARQIMFGSLGLDEAEQTELGKKLARGLVGKVEENDVALLVEPGGSPGGIALFRACKAAFELAYTRLLFATMPNAPVVLDGTTLARFSVGDSYFEGRQAAQSVRPHAKVFVACSELPRIKQLSAPLRDGITVFHLNTASQAGVGKADAEFLESDGFATATLTILMDYLRKFEEEDYKKIRGYEIEEAKPLEATILKEFEVTEDASDRVPYQEIKAAILTKHHIAVNDKQLGLALTNLGVDSVKNSSTVRTKIKRKAESSP